MSSPAIIIKTQFSMANTSQGSFNNFINYMDRKNTHANENEFATYQNYMSNEEKSTGLFTNELDTLSEKDMVDVKSIFANAQKNNGVMWQDVISFDNDWLKETGILSEKNGEPFLDEVKLKLATRNAMNVMWQKEGKEDSIFWSAAIHYNTDNIHVHVASVQTRDFVERGKRKQQSITAAKSSMANTLIDRSKENQLLNAFIRDTVIQNIKNKPIAKPFDRKIKAQFLHVYSLLPEDKRTWKYSMNAMKDIRPELDNLTQLYIDKNFKKEFEAFNKHLDKEVEFYKKTYGNNSRAEDYRKTKTDDLYKRVGNTMLQEFKEYDKAVNKKNANLHSGKWNNKRANFELNRAASQTMYRVNRLMRDDIEHVKNQRAYEQLEHEKEMNR